MKKLLLPLLLVLITGITFSACKKSDSAPSQYMKATLGSTAYTSTQAYAATSASGGFSQLIVAGTDASNKLLEIGINNYSSTTAAGTFAINGNSLTDPAFVTYSDGTNETFAVSGQVVISSISSKSVQGTFSCKMSDSTIVTNGTFSAIIP